MKILFFGTPEEAVPFLEECASQHQVLAAITRADRPAGRGLSVQPPPVKVCAQKLGVPVLQPNQPLDILNELRQFQADAAVVVAYGKILPKEVLESTRLGFLNVHFSLLPKYRGAAPMEWALMNGETKTGVSVFWLDPGMDTGPIQAMQEVPISLEDDSITLRKTLIELGVTTLHESLVKIAGGQVVRLPQVGDASKAPKLTRKDAWVDFYRPALELHNRVRGLAAGPRAFIQLETTKMAVTLIRTVIPSSRAPKNERGKGATPPKEAAGTILFIDKKYGILVQCLPGQIWIDVVQPEGKRQIPAADFVNGLRLKLGDRLRCIAYDQ